MHGETVKLYVRQFLIFNSCSFEKSAGQVMLRDTIGVYCGNHMRDMNTAGGKIQIVLTLK
jgi:hypothetical protein